MNKLMTQYAYAMEQKVDGCYVTVTRLADNAEKVFFLAGNRLGPGLDEFMCSITDEQAEGYWPKEKKKKSEK